MGRNLPPLNALRAFEAAARHLSFTRAAEELNVTPGAVSHQIKGLEDYVGQKLFRRLTRALILTEAGQRALPALRDGFDLLEAAADEMREDPAADDLTVSVSPSFAALWLVPRLDRFNVRHPDIDVRMDASIRVVDFEREAVDVAIRYGPGNYRGLHEDRMFGEVVAPVCSPHLLEGSVPLREPADLAHHTLLHVDWGAQRGTWPDWRMWLAAAGVESVDPTRGPKFSLSETAISAALEGKGVALGSDVLVAREIAAGRLVRPFALTLTAPLNFAYYLVCPPGRLDEPRTAAFRAWILDECRAAQEEAEANAEGDGRA